MTIQIIATGEKLKTSPEYGLRLVEQGKAVFVAEAAPKAKKEDKAKGDAV